MGPGPLVRRQLSSITASGGSRSDFSVDTHVATGQRVRLALETIEQRIEIPDVVHQRGPELHWLQPPSEGVPRAPPDAEVSHCVFGVQAPWQQSQKTISCTHGTTLGLLTKRCT